MSSLTRPCENRTAAQVLRSIVIAALGLFMFGCGIYLIMRANLGIGPWETLNQGLSQLAHIQYGNISIMVSSCILLIDIAMREPIGFGMILDVLIVGKTVDLWNWIDPIPMQNTVLGGLPLLLAGIVIEGFAIFFYMRACLGCGPRDSMVVGLGKRLSRVPIGVISMCLMAGATLCGWLLGGSVGIGTLVCAFCVGPTMQFFFRVFKFEATAVVHQNLAQSIKILLGK